jgi:tRNA modification GTPase
VDGVLTPSDTIAAIATAPGRGGIGVVRLSGPAVPAICQALLGRLPPPRHAGHTLFRDARGQPIDDGLAIYFPAPRSFTGEDVLELQGHGGPVVLRLLLQRCLELGARVAEPGEFSRRAFLNDKLDLAQAEAIADLIEARTGAAARAAVRSMEGEFSDAVRAVGVQLTECRALIEATLDFPEEEIDTPTLRDIGRRLGALEEGLSAILRRSRQGAVLREGLHVVLVGQPNVGKSSLLNRLAGSERAIVTDVPGTTRDTVQEQLELEGVPLNVVDTAGLRETEDAVERMGIERTWAEIARADVVLHLVDARLGFTAADAALGAGLPQGCVHLVVANKIDLAGVAAGVGEMSGMRCIALSARSGDGIERLRDELLNVAGRDQAGEDAFLARARHLEALSAAQDHVVAAGAVTSQLELAAEELREAQECLARLLGEVSADDLLGEIFSRFCIGK